MISLVLIAPAASKAVGNSVSIALGHDVPPGNTYSVPLSPTGQEPATHYGCHTWATEAFVTAIDACIAQTGLPPAPWAEVGLDEAAVYSFCQGLIRSAEQTDNPFAHFNAVLSDNGLQRIVIAP